MSQSHRTAPAPKKRERFAGVKEERDLRVSKKRKICGCQRISKNQQKSTKTIQKQPRMCFLLVCVVFAVHVVDLVIVVDESGALH